MLKTIVPGELKYQGEFTIIGPSDADYGEAGKTMNINVRLKFGLLLMMLLFGHPALSCSCGYAMLQDYYERAESIVVAKKVACVEPLNTEHGFCPDEEWYFNIVEELKGSTTSTRFRGDAQCGLNFEVGETFLLFIGNSKRLNGCGGSGPLGDAGSVHIKSRLQIIREYRDGVIKDFSGPWVFADNGSSCTINHLFKGGHLAINYWYADADARSSSGVMEYSVSGLKADVGIPILRVAFKYPKNIVADSASIQVRGTRWALGRQTLTVKLKSTEKPFDHHAEVIIGAAVFDMLEAMSKPADVVISAMRPSTTQKPSEKPRTPTLFKTRTSRLSAAAEQFMSCVNSTSNGMHE